MPPKKLSFLKKIKNYYKYILEKILVINDTPRSIALGAAFGISIAVTPFFGLQILITLLFDFIFRANIAASMITSAIGNPLTFPFIWIGIYKLGNIFLINSEKTLVDQTSFIDNLTAIKNGILNLNWEIVETNLVSIILPMTIGGLILAVILGIPTYIFTKKLIKKYQNKA